MQPDTPVVAPTPAPPAVPSPAPSSLADFRAQKGTEAPETTPAVAVSAPIVHTAVEELPESRDESEEPQPQAVEAKPPEQTPTHHWKDPELGIGLDLRRKDHKKIRRALDDYAALRAQMRQLQQSQSPRQAEPQRESLSPVQARPDPRDPEPTLAQFADQPDPYASLFDAKLDWRLRQYEATRSRVEQGRQQTAQILTAQERYDAKLPEIAQRYPDFDAAQGEVLEYLSRRDPRQTRRFIARVLQSPIGHDLTHYLGTHPEALDQIFNVPTLDAHLVAIGELEASVKAELKGRATPAPHPNPVSAPITPVGAGASTAVLPDGKSITSLKQFRALKPKLGMSA